MRLERLSIDWLAEEREGRANGCGNNISRVFGIRHLAVMSIVQRRDGGDLFRSLRVVMEPSTADGQAKLLQSDESTERRAAVYVAVTLQTERSVPGTVPGTVLYAPVLVPGTPHSPLPVELLRSYCAIFCRTKLLYNFQFNPKPLVLQKQGHAACGTRHLLFLTALLAESDRC